MSAKRLGRWGVIALACLAGGEAQAVDVAGTTANLGWTAAAGPVAGYDVQVSRNGGAFAVALRVSSPATSVTGAIGDTVVVRVAAYDATGTRGPVSASSAPIHFVSATAPPPPPPPSPTPTPSGSGADLDGNGREDFVTVSAKTGAVRAWLLAARGSKRSSGDLGTAPADMEPVAMGNFDGSGSDDIVWRDSATGANLLWKLTGLTVASQSLPTMTPDWKLGGAGDFDADGIDDLLWHRPSTGESELWRMDAVGVLARTPVMAMATDWRLAGVGDTDGDGRSDVVWEHDHRGGIELWLMSGATPLATAKLQKRDDNERVVAVGDLDRDGRSDLALQAREDGARWVEVWFLNGVAKPNAGRAVALEQGESFETLVDVDADGGLDLVLRGGTSAGARAFEVKHRRPQDDPDGWVVRPLRLGVSLGPSAEILTP